VIILNDRVKHILVESKKEKSSRHFLVSIIQKRQNKNLLLKAVNVNILVEENKVDTMEFGVIVHGNLLG